MAESSGGIAVLYAGATSKVGMKERKGHVDDALRAARVAIEENIIAGGSVVYIRALGALKGLQGDNADGTASIDVIERATGEPLR